MPRLTLHLLGPPLVELDGQTVQLGRHKAVALLAYLALTRQPHSRDALATLLWPDLDQSAARGQLRRTLSLLNRILGDGWLTVDRETAAWAPDAQAWVDVEILRERLDTCASHHHPAQETCPQCIPLLAEAVALYRDGFLAGFTLPDCPGFDEWQFFESEGLRDQAADALQRLARWHGSCDEYDTAIPYARRWLSLDPLHEPAHRALMALYAGCGQHAAALRQYAECERVLGEELGLLPSPETAALHEAIRTRQELPLPDGVAEGTPSPPSAPRQHNLPASLTPFVGREQELDEIERYLQDPDCRLLTLVGPGGIGKTRLALQAAARQIGRYRHGVFCVLLAPVQSAEAIVSTVAQALGFAFYGGGDPRQQLLNYLRHRDLLLVLDNLEHLLDGIDLIDEMLRRAPQVKVLATSRTQLNVRGEHLFHVAGMDYPGEDWDSTRSQFDDYDAVKLFLHSARWVRERYEPTDDDLEHVVRICRLVEGMPLAILLAAAWMDALPPAEIAVQIERGLDFLETDWQSVAERQQSMRAVFDVSLKLLTGGEREVFARMSVFRGGFTAEAAGAVAGADLQTLRGLVHKSFLQRDQAGRYEVHELLRQYGEGKLDETPAERERVFDLHCAYYAEFLHRRETDIWKGYLQEGLLEIDNIRAAMHWATLHRKVAEIHNCLPSFYFLYQGPGLPREAEVILGEVVDALRARETEKLDEERAAALGVALVLHGFFSAYLEHVDKAQELVQESLSILRRLGTRRELAFAYSVAVAARTAQSLSEARELLEESLTISTELSYHPAIPWALWLLGRVALEQGMYREAEQHCREALAVSRRNDDRFNAAYALAFLGHSLYVRKEYARARQCYEESLDLFEKIGGQIPIGRLRSHLGDAALAMGDYEEAREHHHCALARYRDIGVYWKEEGLSTGASWGVPVSLQTLGDIALAEGNVREAKQYYRRALEMARDKSYIELRLHVLLGPIKWLGRKGNVEGAVELAGLVLHHPASVEETKSRTQDLLAELQRQLEPAVFAAAEQRGRARDLEATIRELLVELSPDADPGMTSDTGVHEHA